MGYAFSTYAVDLKKLRPNAKLVPELRESFAKHIERLDEWFDQDVVQRGAPTMARALYQLLAGEPMPKQFAYAYAYALEIVCMHFGKRVGEEDLVWFADTLDPLLRRAKQPTTARLLGKGVIPMKVPMPRAFPDIGSLAPAGCKAALKSLAALPTDDDDVRMVVTEVRRWCESGSVVWFVY